MHVAELFSFKTILIVNFFCFESTNTAGHETSLVSENKVYTSSLTVLLMKSSENANFHGKNREPRDEAESIQDEEAEQLRDSVDCNSNKRIDHGILDCTEFLLASQGLRINSDRNDDLSNDLDTELLWRETRKSYNVDDSLFVEQQDQRDSLESGNEIVAVDDSTDLLSEMLSKIESLRLSDEKKEVISNYGEE